MIQIGESVEVNVGTDEKPEWQSGYIFWGADGYEGLVEANSSGTNTRMPLSKIRKDEHGK